MKLIYISHLRFPSEKTHSTFAMKTCESFAARGIDVELWVPRRWNPKFGKDDPFLYHNIKRNFVMRRLPVIDIWSFMGGNVGFFILTSTFNFSVFFYAVFRGFIRKSVFYIHTPADAILCAMAGAYIFIEIHELNKIYQNGNYFIRWFLSRMLGLIATNRFKAEFLKKRFGISTQHILCQQDAVDVKMFSIETSRKEARRILNVSEAQRVFLYTGHLFAWKGADTLFDVHRFLNGKEMIYFVGGTDNDIGRFRTKSEKLKVKNVVFVGHRPHEEMPLWLRAADVLILPYSAQFDITKYEASPLKLFEYMASGRPTVVADLPSVREIVNEELVWFFKPDSPDSLMEALNRVLSSQEQAEKKARRAREEANLYTWEKRADNIISFIRKQINPIL